MGVNNLIVHISITVYDEFSKLISETQDWQTSWLTNLLLELISDSFDKSGSYYFVKLLEHPCCALFCSFIQQTYNN